MRYSLQARYLTGLLFCSCTIILLLCSDALSMCTVRLESNERKLMWLPWRPAGIRTIFMQASPQEFLEYVVKSLVDNPDQVEIDRKVDEMGVLLTIKNLHKEDMGKIIGKRGQTAKAIRTLLRVVGIKTNARVNMKIDEPEGGMQGGPAMGGADATEVDAAIQDLKDDMQASA